MEQFTQPRSYCMDKTKEQEVTGDACSSRKHIGRDERSIKKEVLKT
jgi:hypothetical protein